jgi:tetratricopeptide (TPR) repeat protein
MNVDDDVALDLAGKQVVFTGRLASLSRTEAAAFVEARGAQCVRTVTRRTDLVVVGEEGLPLTRRGRVNSNLTYARRLQGRTGLPLILTEEAFLERAGLGEQASGVRRLYTPSQLCTVLGVRREQLRAWTEAGLIAPAKTLQNVDLYEFRQAAAIRTLVSLARSGVTTAKLRRNLELLRRCLPNIEYPLEQLALLEGDGRIVFRLEEGMLAESNGQLRFDFAEGHTHAASVPVAPTLEQSWAEGMAHEEAGRLADAAECYRQALRIGGPDPQLCFNLANVLTQQGEHARAVERYWQAIELEPRFAEAWNNLGNALVELGASGDAAEAYRQAIAVDRQYGDAHYNLADLLDGIGEAKAARCHWETFLRLEHDGAWATYARRRLAHQHIAE